jgi:hypothetical protein
MKGTYPTCTFSAKSRTGLTSAAADVCAPTIATAANGAITHIYHQQVKFDSSTPTPQYIFLECQSAADVFVEHPTIMMEGGGTPVLYSFDQSDASNWYHPIGFAEKYDGAHVDAPPATASSAAGVGNPVDGDGSNTNPELDQDTTNVVTYQYRKDGSNLNGLKPDSSAAPTGTCTGTGSTCSTLNNDECACTEASCTWTATNTFGGKMDTDCSGIGLDSYEPQFFFSQDYYSAHTWDAQLKLAVGGKFNAADNTPIAKQDFFYFCHIHSGMNGRVKVVGGGDAAKTNAAAVTFLNKAGDSFKDATAGKAPFALAEAVYYGPAATGIDLACGTSDLNDYAKDAKTPMCTDTFVCDNAQATAGQKAFQKCLHAMDCHMEYHMRTTLHASKPEINFLEQMIPHHANAVNMAKALIKALDGKDPFSGDDVIIPVLQNIVNVQSAQIQYFEDVLDGTTTPKCSGPSMDCNSASTSSMAVTCTAGAAGAAFAAAMAAL